MRLKNIKYQIDIKVYLFVLISGLLLVLSCKTIELNEYYCTQKKEIYPHYSEWDNDSLWIHLSLKDSTFRMVLPYNFRRTISGKFFRKGRVVTFYPDIFILKKKYLSNIKNDIVSLKFIFNDTIDNFYFAMDSILIDIDGKEERTDSNGIIYYSLKKGDSKIIKLKNVFPNKIDLDINIDNEEFNYYEIIITKRLSHINSDYFNMKLRRDGALINKAGEIWMPTFTK